jgi:hypothetical protein
MRVRKGTIFIILGVILWFLGWFLRFYFAPRG